MNYLSDQNYLNRRSKIWREYAPFYLDYWDTLQCGFSISFFDWIGSKQLHDNRWDTYRLLCVNSNNTDSSFEIINVKYPNTRSSYEPKELINTDGNMNSILKHKA